MTLFLFRRVTRRRLESSNPRSKTALAIAEERWRTFWNFFGAEPASIAYRENTLHRRPTPFAGNAGTDVAEGSRMDHQVSAGCVRRGGRSLERAAGRGNIEKFAGLFPNGPDRRLSWQP